MKIAHTADIHIRSLSRHSEYKHVFKAFIEDCKIQNVDHIFVGGDIYHLKTSGISPEYIELLTWWINEMSVIAPVHLVLGNHDGNLTNLSRQDAVSPIISAMNNPRVFLYKKSGTYNFAPGYNFCIFSCFDEDGWNAVRPVENEINIASFHGPVRGCVTDTDWDIESGDITADFFKDYDFCLLGDIHKQQFLGYRNGVPWIGYSGSLLQQNYAESLNHGYLLWEIKSKNNWTVLNRPLPNPNPFVTIDWAGSLNKTIQLAESCLSGTRFRIRSDEQLLQNDVHVLSETLKTSFNAVEVIYQTNNNTNTNLIKTNAVSVSKTDLRSVSVINKLLLDYHADLNLSTKEVELLQTTAKHYLSQVSSVEDIARNSKWSLRQLEWDNTFAFGDKNIINFDKLKGVVGIFGPNRTGKSSIIGTLMYALFNTTDRGPIKNINICNVRKDYCSAKAVFDHDGSSYVIERQTVKSTNKKCVTTASTNLNLFKMNADCSDVIDLCGEQRNDTEKTIRSLLGHPDDFLITSLSAQGETNQFLSQGSSKRRALLTKFLDLDIFDKMHELAAKEVSSVKSQLRNFQDRKWDELKLLNENEVVFHNKVINDLSDLVIDKQACLSQLKSEMSKYNKMPVSQFDVDSQIKRVKDLETSFNNCLNDVVKLENDNVKLHDQSVSLCNLIESVDLHHLKAQQDVYNKLIAEISELYHSSEKEKTVLLNQSKSLKILDDVPCGDDYPSCKFIRDAHVNKRLLTEQNAKVNKSIELLNQTKLSLDNTNNSLIVEKITKHDKAVLLLSKISLEISKKETEIAKLKSSSFLLQSQLVEAQTTLAKLHEALQQHENEEVVTLRSKIEELTLLIKSCDSKKLESAIYLGKLQASIEKLVEEKNARDNLLQNVRVHELISGAFSKNGIPLDIIKLQLPLINNEVTKILQGIVDFTINIESDEDSDSLEIYINYGDSRRIIELCSGMEKMLTAIAVRVAMINISSLPKPDFFIIDEGFGSLDSEGVEACSRLITSLKHYFRTVLVITHVEGIKECADYVLDITKIEKDSKVEFN